jgi:hypothetical protein
MIIVVAVDGCGYQPGAAKSPIPALLPSCPRYCRLCNGTINGCAEPLSRRNKQVGGAWHV